METRKSGRLAFLMQILLKHPIFKTIASLTNDGIWIINLQGQTLYVNTKMASLLGYSAEELINMSVYDFFFPEDLKRSKGRLHNTFNGLSSSHTSKFRRKDGTALVVVSRTGPLQDQNGLIYGALGIFTNITQELTHEVGIAQLASIVESSDDAIWSFDFTGKIKSWNKGAENLYGYIAKEMLEESIYKIIPKNPAILKTIKQLINRLKRGESVPIIESVRQTKSGQIIQVSFNASLIKSSDENIYGISIIERDITLHKKIEQENTELLAQLNGLVEIAPIGIAFVNNQLQFIKTNDTFAEIAGLPFIEHLNKTPNELFNPAHAKLINKQFDSVLSNRRLKSFEIENLRDTPQKQFVSVICYPIETTANHYGIGVILQDITEQKIIERRKDDFLSMASHELKTPLTAIKAFTQLLQLSKQTRAKKDTSLLQKIDQQINRLTKLVNDLLDISKIRSGKIAIEPEWFDFDALVNETIKTYQAAITSHHISIFGKTESTIFADRHRISQVITNLLSNAIKYSPNSDQVEVEMEKQAGHINFSVRDYGIGISPINQKRIFQSFYRVFDPNDNQFPGLGIGLYIASEIIRLHGGTIGVKSRLSAGSLFYFNLPYETKSSHHRRRK